MNFLALYSSPLLAPSLEQAPPGPQGSSATCCGTPDKWLLRIPVSSSAKWAWLEHLGSSVYETPDPEQVLEKGQLLLLLATW